MILIDALYINKGGGLNLLLYLVDSLNSAGKEFFLLYDSRCEGRFNHIKNKEVEVATQNKRKQFYQRNKDTFTSVLCFANVPPPIKLKVPVYTYFHNINMLTLGDGGFLERLKMMAKRFFLYSMRKHTDFWFVQTTNTENQLIQKLNIKKDQIRVLPFFNLQHVKKHDSHGDDYVFIGDYTGSKGHDEIVESWKLLYREGFCRTLHLTCSMTEEFLEKIKEAQNEGVPIVNHGFMPFSGVDALYKLSKALVYPSSNESLGLGIIEAIYTGCDVISSDLPFTHAICNPSGVFNPHSPRSIADAVIQYENGGCPKSMLTIKNEINVIINILN